VVDPRRYLRECKKALPYKKGHILIGHSLETADVKANPLASMTAPATSLGMAVTEFKWLKRILNFGS
jgi:hypothetical protein